MAALRVVVASWFPEPCRRTDIRRAPEKKTHRTEVEKSKVEKFFPPFYCQPVARPWTFTTSLIEHRNCGVPRVHHVSAKLGLLQRQDRLHSHAPIGSQGSHITGGQHRAGGP